MLLQMVPLFWTELWRLVNGCGSNKIFIQVMMSLSRAGTILPGEGCVDCMPHAVLCCLRTESREHNVRENGLKQFKLSPQSLHQCGPLLCSWVCWMRWSGSTPLHIVKWPADRRCSGAPSEWETSQYLHHHSVVHTVQRATRLFIPLALCLIQEGFEKKNTSAFLIRTRHFCSQRFFVKRFCLQFSGVT